MHPKRSFLICKLKAKLMCLCGATCLHVECCYTRRWFSPSDWVKFPLIKLTQVAEVHICISLEVIYWICRCKSNCHSVQPLDTCVSYIIPVIVYFKTVRRRIIKSLYILYSTFNKRIMCSVMVCWYWTATIYIVNGHRNWLILLEQTITEHIILLLNVEYKMYKLLIIRRRTVLK
jgi:hypothetical protein